MKWTCIHGIVVDDEWDSSGCAQCDALGKSPSYNPDVTVQELEELLCDVPIVVERKVIGSE